MLESRAAEFNQIFAALLPSACIWKRQRGFNPFAARLAKCGKGGIVNLLANNVIPVISQYWEMISEYCPVIPQYWETVSQSSKTVPRYWEMAPKVCGTVPQVWEMVSRYYGIIP
jgi:hypothetical protein